MNGGGLNPHMHVSLNDAGDLTEGYHVTARLLCRVTAGLSSMVTVYHESGDVCRMYLWAWGGVSEDRQKEARALCGVFMAWLGEVGW